MNFMRFILFKMSYSPDRGGAGVLYWNADSVEENTTSRNLQVLLNLRFFAQTPDVWVCLRTAGENRKGLVTGAGQRAEHFYEY